MTKDTLHKSEFGLEVVYVIQQRIMFFSKVEICIWLENHLPRARTLLA